MTFGRNLVRLIHLIRSPRRAIRRIINLPDRFRNHVRNHRLLRSAIKRIPVISVQPATPQLVVFVADLVGSRVCKIAYGLKSIGWRIVLLHQGDPSEWSKKCFDKMLRFSSPAEALFLATQFRPVAYHVFSNWNFEVAFLFVRHRPGKIVFDDYDVLAGTLQDNFARPFRRLIEKERFCLENADGLCCRDLETQSVKRQLGYRFRGKRILLWDCCWGDLQLSTSSSRNGTDDFHIVNCGNIPVRTEKEFTVHTEELTQLARTLVNKGLRAQRLHFHTYPTGPIWHGAARNGSEECVNLNNLSVLFHLHNAVPAEELPREFVQYDAGLYHFAIGAVPDTYTQWKFAYTSGNRVFDYLDAGLPVIIHGSRFMEFLTRRARVDIRIEAELSSAAREYLRRTPDGDSLRQNAATARSRFSITNYVAKFGIFYESI